MAEDYILNVVDKISKLDWAFPFQRTGAFPLDRSSLFSSYNDAILYATGGADERGLSGSSYVGQPISVYDQNTNSITLYLIQTDRTLKEVGSVPLTDNQSIEIIDNKLQLKDFKKGYYKYIPAHEDDNGDLVPSTYEYTEGFVNGLILKVVQNEEGTFEIAWFEDFVEQNEKIENIKEELTELNNKIGSPGDENNSSTGIYLELDKKADKVNIYTKDETNLLVNEAINNADHLMRKIVENVDSIDVNADDALRYIYMVPTGLELDDNKYYEYIVIETESTLDGESVVIRQVEKVGSWQINLDDYATKDELQSTEEELNNQITELETNKADKATTLAGYGITDTYTKTEISDLIADITGGESAADVLVQLNEYKTDNDIRVGAIEGNITTIQSDITDIKNGEHNYIKSVDNNFEVSETGKLSLLNVQISQVINLQDQLNNKVEKVDGSRLITSAESSLLTQLSNGQYDNFITSVDESELIVSEGKLSVNGLPSSKITDLQQVLNSRISPIEEKITEIDEALTWQEIPTE